MHKTSNQQVGKNYPPGAPMLLSVRAADYLAYCALLFCSFVFSH